MTTNNPNAQGQQAGAGTPAGQSTTETQPQQSNQGSGTQQQGQGGEAERRIAELTAQVNQLAQAHQEQLAMNNALLAQQLTQGPVTPQQPAPEVDPDLRRSMEAVLAPFMQRLDGLQNQLSQFGVRTVTQQDWVPPEVRQKAEARMAYWAKNRLPGTPEDALVFELGQQAAQQLQQKHQGNQARQNHNNGFTVPLGGTSGAGVAAQPTPPVPALPDAEFRRMTPQQQQQYLAQRMGGFDAPLTG